MKKLQHDHHRAYKYLLMFDGEQKPSYRKMAKDLGICHPQTIKNLVDKLIKYGMVSLEYGIVVRIINEFNYEIDYTQYLETYNQNLIKEIEDLKEHKRKYMNRFYPTK